MPQHTLEEQKKRDTSVITGDVLNPSTVDLQTAQVAPPPDVTKLGGEPIQLEPTKQEQGIQDLTNRLVESNLALVGKEGFRLQQEEEQNIPDLVQAQTDLSAQLNALVNEARAIPIQMQQQAEGRGITAAGLRPLTDAALRRTAIKALTVNSLLEATRGNLATALAMADRAVEAKFGQEEARNAALRDNLQLLIDSPATVLADKNRALALMQETEKRSALMEQQKADTKTIYDLSITALKHGAPSSLAQKIQEARTPQEASLIAAQYLQDPQAKAELQNALLDNQLTRLKIQREADEIALFREFGGLSPDKWLDKQDELREEAKKQQEEVDESVIIARELSTNIAQVDAILNSSALDSVVGPTFLTRSFARNVAGAKGFFGKVAMTVASGIAGAPQGFSLWDEITGNADDVVALVEQIVSQQFLDKLVAEKGKGATFGQLSDREGDALRAAANAISQTAIRDSRDRVVGYDMSEKEFKKQFGIVKERMNYLRTKTTGDIFTDEEKELFDEIGKIQESQQFDPSY